MNIKPTAIGGLIEGDDETAYVVKEGAGGYAAEVICKTIDGPFIAAAVKAAGSLDVASEVVGDNTKLTFLLTAPDLQAASTMLLNILRNYVYPTPEAYWYAIEDDGHLQEFTFDTRDLVLQPGQPRISVDLCWSHLPDDKLQLFEELLADSGLCEAVAVYSYQIALTLTPEAGTEHLKTFEQIIGICLGLLESAE